MRTYFANTFASLRIRNYRLFIIGQGVAKSGDWMQKLAQAWLVLELTGSGTLLGVVTAIQMVPTLVGSPWAGLLADRYHKRAIMIWAAVLGFVPSLLLAVMTLTGHVTIQIVLVLALLGGVGDALDKPARHSLPFELVGRSDLPNAVNLASVVQEAGKALGPAIGGLLIASIGLPYTFMVNAVSFVAAAVLLALMDSSEFVANPLVKRQPGQFRESLRYVRSEPYLLGPLMLLASAGLLGYNFQVLLPLLGKEVFDGDARTVGLLLGALGLGATVAGVLLAGMLKPVMRTVTWTALAFGGFFVAVGLSPNLMAAMLLVGLLGATSVVFKTRASTLLQLRADGQMRGRVMALLVMALAGMTPVGAPLTGWLAHEFGPRLTFVVAGVGVALAAVATHLYLRRHAAPVGVSLPVAAPRALAKPPSG